MFCMFSEKINDTYFQEKNYFLLRLHLSVVKCLDRTQIYRKCVATLFLLIYLKLYNVLTYYYSHWNFSSYLSPVISISPILFREPHFSYQSTNSTHPTNFWSVFSVLYKISCFNLFFWQSVHHQPSKLPIAF